MPSATVLLPQDPGDSLSYEPTSQMQGLRDGTEEQHRMAPALSPSSGIWVILCAQLVKFTASCASPAKLLLTVRIQIKGSSTSAALPPHSSLDYTFSMD